MTPWYKRHRGAVVAAARISLKVTRKGLVSTGTSRQDWKSRPHQALYYTASVNTFLLLQSLLALQLVTLDDPFPSNVMSCLF